MPLPASVTTVPVHVKIVSPVDGTPGKGRVLFTGPYTLRDTTDNVIMGPPSVSVTLDVNGEATVSLIATDDPDISPSGWAYTVYVATDVLRESYLIQIPYATVGTLELADIAPAVTPPSVVTYALDSAAVHRTGDETIAGVKTFSSSPSVPTPSSSGDAASKGYVDSTTQRVFAVAWTGLAATDTAAIQAAIDAAKAAGGGIAWLADGAYTLSAGLVMRTGVDLAGSSSQNVSLTLANGVNADVITSEGFASLTGTQPADPNLTASGPSGWRIRGIEIVGNQAGQTGTSWGIRVWGYGYRIDDVRIRDCRSGGLYTEFAHSGSYSSTATGVEAEFTNLRIHHNGGTGWQMRGPNDSHAVGCLIWENTGFGLWAQTIPGGCSANGVNLFNVHAYGSAHTWGMVFDAQVMASQCQSEGASVGQVWMRYAECLWVGGSIYDINPAGGNGLGLRLGDSSTSTYAVRCFISTLLTGWTGADGSHVAVDFAQTSNCWVNGRVQLTTATGNAINGTPDPSDVVALAVSGSGGMTTATALQKSIFKQRGVTTFDVGSASQAFRLVNQFTDLFNLNSASNRFEIPNGLQWRMYAGAYTGEKLRFDGAIGHIEAINTTVVTAAAAAGLGTSPPAVGVDTNSNDMRGLINFGTGTSPTTGAAVSVTFANAFSRTPTVMLIAKNGATAALQPYLGAVSATGFNINLANAPAAGQAASTYFVAYLVMG